MPIEDSSSNNENPVDPSYNATYNEEDCNYDDILSGLTFLYSDLTHELSPPPNMYKGRGPALRHGIARKFSTVIECVAVVGGLEYNYFKRLTANSNEYVRMNMNNCGKFGGSPWSNITVEEMIQFHGTVLKMSIDDRQLGGYPLYFTKSMSVNSSRDYSVLLHDYPAWALQVFALGRFKQIRAAFHPEVGQSTVGDKCHQLPHVLNTLNQASFCKFIPGIDLSLNKGGVASRSRLNSGRQYNKDKPQKFQVNFLSYVISHLDSTSSSTAMFIRARILRILVFLNIDSELTYNSEGSHEIDHPIQDWQ